MESSNLTRLLISMFDNTLNWFLKWKSKMICEVDLNCFLKWSNCYSLVSFVLNNLFSICEFNWNVRIKILLLTLSLVARLLRYQQNGYARTPLRPTLLKPGWTLMTGNLRKATNNKAPVRFPILANRSPWLWLFIKILFCFGEIFDVF